MCPYFERHEYFSVALMRMMLIGCQRFLSSSAAKEIANASQFSLYIYFHINKWVWLVGISYLQFLVWNWIHQMRLSFDYISFMQIVFLGHKNLNLIIFCKCNKLSFCSGQKQPLFCHQQCFIALMKCDFGYVSLETDKKDEHPAFCSVQQMSWRYHFAKKSQIFRRTKCITSLEYSEPLKLPLYIWCAHFPHKKTCLLTQVNRNWFILHSSLGSGVIVCDECILSFACVWCRSLC